MRQRREIPIHIFELAYARVSYASSLASISTMRRLSWRQSQHDRITTSWRRFITYDYLIPDSTYNV